MALRLHPLIVLGGVVGSFALNAQARTATFELPAPTGKFPVGTTQWVVGDPSRQETFAPGRQREVQVIAWYPRSGASGASGA